MPDNDADILREAIARNVAAVLSLPSAGMLRHHKSRLLTESEGGILMEAPPNEPALINALLSSKEPCGVSFRNGSYKVMFIAPLLELLQGWQINAQTKVDAVVLEFPKSVKALQRRANYRVEVPSDFEMSVRIWRISDRAYLKDQPMAAQEVKAQVRDISIGGLGVRLFGKDDNLPTISSEDRLRILLKCGDQMMVMEGRMRAGTMRPQQGNALITGIQFKKLQNDLEGRQITTQLTRIVGELQRAEARRMRLGLAKPA